MEHRTDSLEEQVIISERAFDWLSRAERAGDHDKGRLLEWLKRSPEHGGELVASAATEVVLRQLFRNRPIDVTPLLPGSSNVVEVARPQRYARSPVRRLFLSAVKAGFGLAVLLSFRMSASLIELGGRSQPPLRRTFQDQRPGCRAFHTAQPLAAGRSATL